MACLISAFGDCVFALGVVGCNQPQQDPVAEVWRQTLPGQIKKYMVKEAAPVDREKVKQFVKRCMDKATDAELRAIGMVAYHVTKKER